MPTPVLKSIENGSFYAFWSEGRRSKRRSMGTKSRVEAEARFARWLLLGGHHGDKISTEETAGKLTVSELWSVYDEKYVQIVPAAPKAIEYAWANLRVHFGPVTAETIDQDFVDEYERKRKSGEIGPKPVKSATVRKELVLLKACFNWHASPQRGKKRLLDKRDVPAFTLPPDGEPRERWLRSDEIERLLAAAPLMHPGENRMSRGERFLWLALETAGRSEAIRDLTWDRVDFEVGVIHLHKPGRRETKKRRPSVPISARLMPVLKRMHAERLDKCPYVLDNKSNVWATVQLIVIKAGLAPEQKRDRGVSVKGTGISPHTLRHTAATQMARRGVPLYDIAGVLGNSLAMVEKVYAKHCPDRLRAAVNAISPVRLEAAE